MEEAIAELTKRLPKIRSPAGGEKVYKDECAYSFDNPESRDGLYICMNSFLGIGKRHLQDYYNKTGNGVFLRIKRLRREVPKDESTPEPTKMAIGVEGGFQTDDKKFEFEEQTSIVVLPHTVDIPLSCQDIPPEAQISAAMIIAAEDAAKMEEAAAMAGTWEGEKLRVSKHAENLLQLEPAKKIPPSGWKCERCDLTCNLWLNLTDGSILCGRKFFDGSGGNNHALEHYQQFKYPLAVKLGTITDKSGDVFSYDEDDMVEDPYLAKHLAHFGINVAALEKTDKTMTELEIDINQKIGEWDVIQESGSSLTPVHGAGYTGMRNLGNSCYMNSVMQVLMTLPDFQHRYYSKCARIVQDSPARPTADFNTQMTKLADGLLSGEYSKPAEDSGGSEAAVKYVAPPSGIKPQMFKNLVGKGHPEFSTKRQQDAHEYFLHILQTVQKNSRGAADPCDCVKFQVEERVACSASKKVGYTRREDFCLALPVPMEMVTNTEQVKKYIEAKAANPNMDPASIVRPIIPFSECINSFMQSELIDDFYSSAIKGKTTATKTTRMATFPDFLFIQLRKYTVGDDWVPRKLDVSITPPDELDLSPLRGAGLQSGEEELPDAPAANPPPAVQIDSATVDMLQDMGFPREACRRAVHKTGNVGVEPAMNWLFEHSGDPDFADPFDPAPASSTGKGFVPNPDVLAMVMSMGFTAEQATKALKATNNSAERAVDWIFSHADDLDTEDMDTEQSGPSDSNTGSGSAQFRDGSEKYKLVAFISHMGTSTSVGHYVCHILKDGRWVIFNDEKVALSENPPKDLAYLYLYQRV